MLQNQLIFLLFLVSCVYALLLFVCPYWWFCLITDGYVVHWPSVSSDKCFSSSILDSSMYHYSNLLRSISTGQVAFLFLLLFWRSVSSRVTRNFLELCVFLVFTGTSFSAHSFSFIDLVSLIWCNYSTDDVFKPPWYICMPSLCMF